ncbi:MAG: U32 family peptidase [Prevotella sp.]|nr:U32 family peptidase [Prevotella sp.]
MKQSIELLAPAKNLTCGIAAIDHGADAVYIGAQRYGARVAAGNSVEDIAELCRYAHPFGAKVYVTVNTIIFNDELDDTHQLLIELEKAGVDAILVQDSSLFTLHYSLPLHASTQTDNRTPEKVAWLRSLGFKRVVLARELSVEEIREIHQQVPDVELEVFVHGALCVSYSGQCYASQYCFGRSANRGACAQFCRLPFDLVDSNGRTIEQGRHLLSLKDLCQIDHLEELMEAGAVSFKIEGRLKDVDYVKNVTAAYSQRLNQIIARHPERYQRASQGRCTYTFEPNLKKTFNRGFTTYFLHGRQPDIFSPDTPKALGEYVGRVKEIRRDSFNVAGTASFANGDGLCFFLEERGERREERKVELCGFRVNRAEGNRLYPYKMPAGLKPGMALYRNNDMEFERQMAGKTAERKIPLTMTLEAVDGGFKLNGIFFEAEHQQAQKPQRENIIRQLTKLGGTPYVCDDVELVPNDFNYFIPSSQLAEWRRQLVSSLILQRNEQHRSSERIPACEGQMETYDYPHLYNAANEKSREFYAERGVSNATAMEVSPMSKRTDVEPLLMQCRHCLRYSLGYCVRKGGEKPRWQEPLYLVSGDGRRFRLEFDCRKCQMNVWGL